MLVFGEVAEAGADQLTHCVAGPAPFPARKTPFARRNATTAVVVAR